MKTADILLAIYIWKMLQLLLSRSSVVILQVCRRSRTLTVIALLRLPKAFRTKPEKRLLVLWILSRQKQDRRLPFSGTLLLMSEQKSLLTWHRRQVLFLIYLPQLRVPRTCRGVLALLRLCTARARAMKRSCRNCWVTAMAGRWLWRCRRNRCRYRKQRVTRKVGQYWELKQKPLPPPRRRRLIFLRCIRLAAAGRRGLA